MSSMQKTLAEHLLNIAKMKNRVLSDQELHAAIEEFKINLRTNGRTAG